MYLCNSSNYLLKFPRWCPFWPWRYSIKLYRVLWDMEYSIVLTKAAFVHAKYLELYSSGGGSVDAAVDAGGGGIAGETPPGASSNWSEAMIEAMVKTRAYVDSHRNCEDIAMQMVRGGRSGRFFFCIQPSISNTHLFLAEPYFSAIVASFLF